MMTASAETSERVTCKRTKIMVSLEMHWTRTESTSFVQLCCLYHALILIWCVFISLFRMSSPLYVQNLCIVGQDSGLCSLSNVTVQCNVKQVQTCQGHSRHLRQRTKTLRLALTLSALRAHRMYCIHARPPSSGVSCNLHNKSRTVIRKPSQRDSESNTLRADDGRGVDK